MGEGVVVWCTNRVEGGEWYVGSGVGRFGGTHKRDIIMIYLFSYLGIRRTARATPRGLRIVKKDP